MVRVWADRAKRARCTEVMGTQVGVDNGDQEASRPRFRVASAATSPRSSALLLRGAPGVGKSTVAGLLMDRGVASRVIEVDAIRGPRSDVNWSDREQHDAALVIAAGLAVKTSRESPSVVVVVDTFGRDTAITFACRRRQGACHPIIVGMCAQEQVLLRDERSRSATLAPLHWAGLPGRGKLC